jgi:hypothetical protein
MEMTMQDRPAELGGLKGSQQADALGRGGAWSGHCLFGMLLGILAPLGPALFWYLALVGFISDSFAVQFLGVTLILIPLPVALTALAVSVHGVESHRRNVWQGWTGFAGSVLALALIGALTEVLFMQLILSLG